jgi:hypothetical protein
MRNVQKELVTGRDERTGGQPRELGATAFGCSSPTGVFGAVATSWPRPWRVAL